MRRIQRVLPEARFVHIIRDGRDVSLSHLRMNWGPETYEESARLWRNRIRKARKMAPTIDHYMEVRFEDLVADTEGVLRRVCEFIELDFDPVMLDYHERAEGRLARRRASCRARTAPPARRGAAGEPPARQGAAALGPDRDVARADDARGGRRVRGGRGDLLVELGYELGTEAGERRAAAKASAAGRAPRTPEPVE